MRNLARNQRLIYYKTLESKEEIIDDDGNATGDYSLTYSELKSLNISVSADKGTSEADAFGTSLEYDRTLSTADTSCEIDENSILWIEADPTTSIEPAPHDFIVKKRAPSLNQVLYAIKAVDVRNG